MKVVGINFFLCRTDSPFLKLISIISRFQNLNTSENIKDHAWARVVNHDSIMAIALSTMSDRGVWA